MNCIKLGRECPGYPDQLDLLFKHETESVTRKATRGKKQRSAQASSSRRQSSTSSLPKSPSQDTLALSRKGSGASNNPDAHAFVQEPVQLSGVATWDSLREVNFNSSARIVSIATFFNTVATRPSAPASTSGLFDVLIPLFAASPSRSPLHTATEAIAVRVVAGLPGRSEDLLEHADCLYSVAVQGVQQAINDPQRALTDETLLTVLLFAVSTILMCIGRTR